MTADIPAEATRPPWLWDSNLSYSKWLRILSSNGTGWRRGGASEDPTTPLLLSKVEYSEMTPSGPLFA